MLFTQKISLIVILIMAFTFQAFANKQAYTIEELYKNIFDEMSTAGKERLKDEKNWGSMKMRTSGEVFQNVTFRRGRETGALIRYYDTEDGKYRNLNKYTPWYEFPDEFTKYYETYYDFSYDDTLPKYELTNRYEEASAIIVPLSGAVTRDYNGGTLLRSATYKDEHGITSYIFILEDDWKKYRKPMKLHVFDKSRFKKNTDCSICKLEQFHSRIYKNPLFEDLLRKPCRKAPIRYSTILYKVDDITINGRKVATFSVTKPAPVVNYP